MRKITAMNLTGQQAWDAMDIDQIDNATIRLHWTDTQYKWHVNDGSEVFVVLDGEVEMRFRQNGVEESFNLKVGDIFHAETGDEHLAIPKGVARILVIEKAGSV